MTGENARRPGRTPAPETAVLAAARFTIEPGGRMQWAEGIYRLLGLQPGDVTPSIDVLSQHVHPDDRQAWAADVRELTDSTAFARWTRLLDINGAVHTAMLVGAPTDGGVHGYLVDLTGPLRQTEQQSAASAVAASAEFRGVIEQAKGMLMVILDIDADEAFRLLRWHSTNGNIKLRVVATTIVERLADPSFTGQSPRERLGTVLTNLGGSVTRAAPPPRPDQYQRQIHARAVSELSRGELGPLLANVVAHAGQSIAIGDSSMPGSPLMYANDAFAKLTGYPLDEILGKTCHFLQGPDSDPAAIAALGAAVRQGEPTRVVIRNYRKDGSTFWNEVDISPVKDPAGTLTHVIGYQIDVTDRVRREEMLHRLAYFDPATGYGNEAWVRQRVQDVPSDAERPVARLRVAGAGIDPSVLQSAAAVLDSARNGGGWVARVRDDTFLLAVGDGVDIDAVTAGLQSNGAPLQVETEQGPLARFLDPDLSRPATG